MTLYTDSERAESVNWNCHCSGTTGDNGLSSHAFEYKGVVYVAQQEPDTILDQDKAMELAIEAGAEEVQEGVDDEGNKVFKVCTLQWHAHAVKVVCLFLKGTALSCMLQV